MSGRFGKRADAIVHQLDPFNAETPRAQLDTALTSNDAFYVRSHGPVPRMRTEDWRLRIDGEVDRPLELSLEELRDRFAEQRVVATMQCAGNRRAGLMAVRDIPGEAPWGPGATGTAVWQGVALADVLAAARPRAGALHVGFAGRDLSDETQPPERYGGSIPRAKAEQPEVLLAWGMNHAPLPAVHGGPLRAVVPGYVGARSVKWLERIELRRAPWDGFFQTTAYRLLPADAEPHPGAGVPLGEIPLNADILAPEDGSQVEAGVVEVRGYAFAGGRREVVRVDVSSDRGRTWTQAVLADDLGRWAWRQWRARVRLAAGEQEIVARAWDSAGASQPEHAAPLWNPKGYVNTAWGRVRLTAA